MGMVLTTSRTGDIEADWIFDPAHEDGHILGLMIDTQAMTVHDILDALGLEHPGHPDPTWPLETVKARLAAAQAAVDPDDDYLAPRLAQLATVIVNGEARGARFLIAT